MVRFGSKVVYVADPEDVWGNVNKVGNAELAARLGSINKYDRRGATVFMDDVEHGLVKWDVSTTGDRGSCDVNANYAKSGSNSLKCVTGGTENDGVQLQITHRDVKLDCVGFELSFACAQSGSKIKMSIIRKEGGFDYVSNVIFDMRAKTLTYYYVDEDGVGHDVVFETSPPTLSSVYTWNTLKLVVDFKTMKYSRVLFNDKEYDLSDKALRGLGAGAGKWFYLRINVYNTAALPYTIYLDDIIFTQNDY